jgi:YebC/PmpR family DNA-binding regulatory protein
MSGHSHYSSIKYKKAVTDAKRSKVFSKLSREITIAAKEGGGDSEINSKLRLAVEKAKQWNLPKENIERAIKRGTGEIEGVKIESVIFEAYGPGGIAIIIEGITDNKNRTLAEIKQILNQHNGKLVSEGSVKWLFEKKGCLVITLTKETSTTKEELELMAIEAGAEDIYQHNNILDVYTKLEELENIKKNLEEKGIKIESVSLDWVAKEEISLNEKGKAACQELFEALDENESVQEIYSNLKV